MKVTVQENGPGMAEPEPPTTAPKTTQEERGPPPPATPPTVAGSKEEKRPTYVPDQKTNAKALIELLALWNTLWSYIAFNLKAYFPATDGFWGGFIAILVGGLGNILSVYASFLKSNAELAAGIKEKADIVQTQKTKLDQMSERVQTLEARHLHDIAMNVAYEAEVLVARGQEQVVGLADRMKKELKKIGNAANAAVDVYNE